MISQSPEAGPDLLRLAWGASTSFWVRAGWAGLVKSGGPIAGLSSRSELQSRFLCGGFSAIVRPEVSVPNGRAFGPLA